ncbi:MAG: N-acetyl-gamma-glutamyl-phosphate reductase [Neisseriaceae bacterium]
MTTKPISVSVVGGSGYTGVELLRLLAQHPKVEVVNVISRQERGRLVTEVFPHLRGKYELVFSDPDEEILKSGVVFFATPHMVAMKQADNWLQQGVRVIDLSADFRFRDIELWERWYGVKHASPQLARSAVYGFPELNSNLIKEAALVAVPGCYVTAVTLALLPVLEHGLLKAQEVIIADCKSGVSGAGRSVNRNSLLAEMAENFKAYGLQGHRHLPEIQQNIALFDPALAKQFVFVPHLLPMVRGLQATVYLSLENSAIDLQTVYEDFYHASAFVEILSPGEVPETKNVRGSNRCQIAIQRLGVESRYVVIAVIDNLMKGAAGQAIQNLNLMFGWEESCGLGTIPVVP